MMIFMLILITKGLAKTIYVAATRARKKLVLIYKNNPLDFILKSDLITTVGR